MIDKERYKRVFCSCLDGNRYRKCFEGTDIPICDDMCFLMEHCRHGVLLYKDKETGKIVRESDITGHIPTAHEIAVAYDECYDI